MQAINTQVDQLLASLPPLKAYGTLGRRQAQHCRFIKRICAALLVDDTIRVMQGHPWLDFSKGGEQCGRPRSATRHWIVEVGEAATVIHPPNVQVPRDCTREDLDRAREALTPYSATAWVLSGWGWHQRSAAMHTLEDVVYTQLSLAREVKDLRVTTQKIWVVICPDATPLWRTQPQSVTCLCIVGVMGFRPLVISTVRPCVFA